MDSLSAHDVTLKNGETTRYYEGGSKDGTPLIFIHGWPDIAESWKHQLSYFSAQSKYRVIAPDMRGYGDSTSPKDRRAYSMETLSEELVEFAEKLGVKKAVWIGHDWGCGVTNALAAHYPELFIALVDLAVPYRTIELGLKHIVGLVNRDLYPEDEYEYGQWEYMRYYELHTGESVKSFDDHVEKITKVLYAKGGRHEPGKPAMTSRILREGGWFSGHPEALPDVPLEATSLDESLYGNLLKSHKKHGFFPPTAYYLNHDANAEYAKSEKNGGVLEFPVLYIDAKLDSICTPSAAPKYAEEQAKYVKDLTYETIEAAHWVQLERPKEVNEALEKWLNKKL
ncbi:alpha/beta-hydrolase [Setomelanomma holmii]|uniref:Alpha/beta-hydrolase n=1 Tax=Setomelanomma holmii TaxID=210430 RepID=A0A9P4LM89_9PLEO|nr:alpha/beta-hydrolase [Setomelanomma holmii]